LKSSSDSQGGRLVLLVCALLFFYGFLLGGGQYVIADAAGEYGAGGAGMGLLVSAQYAAAAVAPAAMGAAADRQGKRRLLSVFAAVFGTGCGLCALSRSAVVYAAGALAIGAGYSVCESLGSAALTDLGPGRGARYVALSQGVLSVGAVSGPLLARGLLRLPGADWRVVYAVCAAAFLLLALPLARTHFPPPQSRTPGERARFFSDRAFRRLFFAVVLYVGLENGFGYFVGSLFALRFPGGALGAYAISAYWAGMTLSRLGFSLKKGGTGRAVPVCLALSAAAFAGLALSNRAALCLALCALIGAAFGPVWAALIAGAAARFPASSAGAVGMMSSGCGLGGMLYPPLMGLLFDGVGMTGAFWALAATAAADCALCLRGAGAPSVTPGPRPDN
jgi:fucose permease